MGCRRNLNYPNLFSLISMSFPRPRPLTAIFSSGCCAKHQSSFPRPVLHRLQTSDDSIWTMVEVDLEKLGELRTKWSPRRINTVPMPSPTKAPEVTVTELDGEKQKSRPRGRRNSRRPSLMVNFDRSSSPAVSEEPIDPARIITNCNCEGSKNLTILPLFSPAEMGLSRVNKGNSPSLPYVVRLGLLGADRRYKVLDYRANDNNPSNRIHNHRPRIYSPRQIHPSRRPPPQLKIHSPSPSPARTRYNLQRRS